MRFLETQKKNLIRLGVFSLTAFFATFPLAAESQARIVIEKKSSLGIIKGIVRDDRGKPISDAIVAVFHLGTSKILKQVRSSDDGSFLAKILPGKYTILAVAQGFNPTTLSEVQINQFTELNYGFKLERAGSGNTLPEKAVDRKNSKWIVRAAQNQRSIYQANEGKSPVDENKIVAKREDIDENLSYADDDAADAEIKRRGQSVVETYFAGADDGGYTGFNFATLQPLGEDTEIVFAGQTGTSKSAPQRFETTVKSRINDDHQVRVSASAASLGKINNSETAQSIGQISLQALDEWQVRNGVILVLGFDYSRLTGAGNASALSPRLGMQFDVDAKTRFKTAYTTQTEERSWSDAIELEGSQILFREQFAPRAIAVKDSKPLMNKSRRLEFGIERVLDNSSNIEATAFFDTVTGRGIGITNLPAGALDAENFEPFTVQQQGAANGVRIVYSRRLNSIFSASAGYAFGNGQKLSAENFSNSANIFDSGIFQTFVGQLNVDLKTGTHVKTIFRLSPQATIFAIDPFQGRLAIYDPGLSFVMTQSLPTLGLPIRAEAVVDARNLFDSQFGAANDEGSLKLNLQRRAVRGGISVRF